MEGTSINRLVLDLSPVAEASGVAHYEFALLYHSVVRQARIAEGSI